MIDWSKTTLKENRTIAAIGKRACKLRPDLDFQSTIMDITATHISGCKLKLEALLKAKNFDFFHDIIGIANCLDRDTGKLQNCFLPRYSA